MSKRKNCEICAQRNSCGDALLIIWLIITSGWSRWVLRLSRIGGCRRGGCRRWRLARDTRRLSWYTWHLRFFWFLWAYSFAVYFWVVHRKRNHDVGTFECKLVSFVVIGSHCFPRIRSNFV